LPKKSWDKKKVVTKVLKVIKVGVWFGGVLAEIV
jgi:hypothetical protein